MFSHFITPAADDANAVQLVLPRHLLTAQLQRSAPASTATTNAQPRGTLAHGPLYLQAPAGERMALVPQLQNGPPQRLPVTARIAPGPASAAGPAAGAPSPPASLALVYRATAGEAPPPNPTAWDAWLARCAPEYRLACTALVPDVAVLWLQADGAACGWLRTGDAWAALQGEQTRTRWLPMQHLALPGAYMLNTRRSSATTAPAPSAWQPASHPTAAAPTAAVTEEPTLRHSRLEGALGADVLHNLQASLWLVVGCDTTGSMLAHSLARMGVNLLVLDPAPMDAHSLDADLPPLREGQPKPVALQHLLRGLLRPGARCDARVLSVASPAAGSLLALADGLLCCSANPQARLWANAWAQALLKPLLAVRTTAGAAGCAAELQLVLPGAGCLACGQNQAPAAAVAPARPAPRSWQGVAAHATLRLLEHLYAGTATTPVVRHLAETPEGGLDVQDRSVPAPARLHCPLCQRLAGRGLAAVRGAMLDAAGRTPP